MRMRFVYITRDEEAPYNYLVDTEPGLLAFSNMRTFEVDEEVLTRWLASIRAHSEAQREISTLYWSLP